MKAVVLEVPARELERRRRLGLDVFDEMWEGVLHMVPPPSNWHQSLGSELIAVFISAARRRGLKATYETGLFAADDDYRVPDLIVSKPEDRSERGVENTAALVVELLSPRDETYEKLPWYADRGVNEICVIEPVTRRVELYVSRGGSVVAVQPDPSGAVMLQSVGARLSTADTPDGVMLRVELDGEVTFV